MLENYIVNPCTTTPDFDITDFTLDSAWHNNGLDLSPIVPAGATTVHLMIRVRATASAARIRLRPNDSTRSENEAGIRCEVDNVYSCMVHVIMLLDSDRKLDYNCLVTLDQCDIWVAGWEIPDGQYHLVLIDHDTAADFDNTDFTPDGNWHVDGLNMSAFIPAGAIAVIIQTDSTFAGGTTYFYVRGNATTKNANYIMQEVQNPASAEEGYQHIVHIDSDRLLDYKTDGGVGFGLDMKIIGYYI